MIQICLGSAVPSSPTLNFQPPPFEQEPIQDRFGLLTIHSAKPTSPPADFLRDFNDTFTHSDFDKVSPKGQSLPWEVPREFTLSVSTALPHLLQGLELIRPPGPPQNISRFATGAFNHRYRRITPDKQ